MADAPRPVFHATIDAFLRGVEFSGEGTVELVGDAIGITVGKRRALVNFARLDGIRESHDTLELFADTGDVITLQGTEGLQRLARAIRSSALRLPELTRSLRGLGSHRAHPNAEHDRFFAPLLKARARAERTTDPEGRLDAFNGAKLRADIEEQIVAFARARYPDRAPDRRATEAILGECTEEFLRRLTHLEEAATAVRQSAAEVQLVKWRRWRDAVHDVIDAADRCWFAMRPVLEEPVAPRRRWWQRGTG